MLSSIFGSGELQKTAAVYITIAPLRAFRSLRCSNSISSCMAWRRAAKQSCRCAAGHKPLKMETENLGNVLFLDVSCDLVALSLWTKPKNFESSTLPMVSSLATDWTQLSVQIVACSSPCLSAITKIDADGLPGFWTVTYVQRMRWTHALIFWLRRKKTLLRASGRNFPASWQVEKLRAKPTLASLVRWRSHESFRLLREMLIKLMSGFSHFSGPCPTRVPTVW